MRANLHVFIGAALGLGLGCGGVQEQGDDIPAIESLDPAVGGQAGGTSVTLTGTGLDFGTDVPTRVAIGTAVVDATVVDDATITFTTPPGAAGSVDVVVFHGGGATTALRAFTYAPLPTVTSISPDLAGEGDTVTIRGTGFSAFNAGAASAAIDGAALSSVEVVDDTTLTGVLPAVPGLPFTFVDVEITNDNGTAALPEAFRFTKQGILALTNRQSAHRWYYIDPTNADAFFIGHSPGPIVRAATATTGEIMVVTDASSTGNTLSQLGLFDPASLGVSSMANFDVLVNGGDMEIDGADIFYLDRRNDTLRRFNISTGLQQSAAAVTLTARGAPTCIFRNDATTLFTITEMDGNLRTVNKANGTIAVVAALQNGPVGHFCHGAARINNQTFVLAHLRSPRETRLMRLNTATGELTEIGLIRDRTNDDRVDVRYTSMVATPASF